MKWAKFSPQFRLDATSFSKALPGDSASLFYGQSSVPKCSRVLARKTDCPVLLLKILSLAKGNRFASGKARNWLADAFRMAVCFSVVRKEKNGLRDGART